MSRYHILLFVTLALGSCKKTADTLDTAQLSDYFPMAVGKFIRYQLDSTRYIDFGQRDTIVSYDAKDVVEAEITDNLGRPAYRVVRYLRSLASSSDADYVPSLVYAVTPGRESIELSENNLRYQKLRLPIRENFTWRGNSFLPTTPFYVLYEFSNDEDMDIWNYTYYDVSQSSEVGNSVYDSTVTVIQVEDSSNVPIEFPDGLAYKNYWVEKYAKNIGLIYREVEMWEYQPPNGGNPGYRSGFGIKLTIRDHN